MQFSPNSSYFLLLKPKYFLSPLFPDILCLCSSLNMGDKVHTHLEVRFFSVHAMNADLDNQNYTVYWDK